MGLFAWYDYMYVGRWDVLMYLSVNYSTIPVANSTIDPEVGLDLTQKHMYYLEIRGGMGKIPNNFPIITHRSMGVFLTAAQY